METHASMAAGSGVPAFDFPAVIVQNNVEGNASMGPPLAQGQARAMCIPRRRPHALQFGTNEVRTIKHAVCSVAIAVASLLSQATAMAQPCGQVKVGYHDQDRVPVTMRSGEVAAHRPSAAIELMRATLEARGCTVSLVRLPAGRLRSELVNGSIDLAPVMLDDQVRHPFVTPAGPNGAQDLRRAVALNVAVFVRAEDNIPSKTPPMQYFSSRILGANLGAPLVAVMRQRGLHIDDGALDLWRNLEKLRLRRIDGVVLVSVNDEHLNARINREHKGTIVKLSQPILQLHYTLGASPDFYQRQPQLVQAIWDDIGRHGPGQFQEKLKQYLRND